MSVIHTGSLGDQIQGAFTLAVSGPADISSVTILIDGAAFNQCGFFFVPACQDDVLDAGLAKRDQGCGGTHRLRHHYRRQRPSLQTSRFHTAR